MLATACDQLMAVSAQHIADHPDSGVPPFSSFFTENIDILCTVDHSSAVFEIPLSTAYLENQIFQCNEENDNFLGALLDTGAQKS